MADTKPIGARAKEIIVEQLGCNPALVTDEATFEALGADSLDCVEIVMAFEGEFNVEIPDQNADRLQTVGKAIEFIEDTSKDTV